MNASVLVSLIAGLLNLVVAVVVLLSSPRQRLHRACAAWGFSVAVWNLGVFFLGVVRSESVAEIWARITWTAVAFLPVSIMHFLELSFERRRRDFTKWYAVTLVTALGIWTPIFMRGVQLVADIWYARPGPGLWLLVGLFLPLSYLLSIRLLVQESRAPSRAFRRRAWLLLGVILACQVLGSNDLLPVFGFATYPFTDVKVPLLGPWAAASYAVVVGYGIFSDQLIEMRISLGRSLAHLLRLGLLFTICTLLLLLFNVLAPDQLPIGGVFGALGALVVATFLAGVFSPRLIMQPSEALRDRVFGDRFDYLEKIRALPEALYLEPDMGRGATRVCLGLRDTLRLGDVTLWYRDPLGLACVVPERSPSLSEAARTAGWAQVARESQDWLDREDLWVLPLRTVGEAPSGYLRLEASPGGRLHLNELDREAIAEIVGILAHQVERESIRASLQLRRANDAKDRFLASINHEIRNPLNGLVGMVELLHAESPDPRAHRRLETMRACADQLIAVMDNALDFASLSEGRLPLRETRFELGGLLRGSVAHLEIGTEGRVFWDLPPDVVWLAGDAGKLRQIVSNYVANALKYGRPPHASVRATVRDTAAGAGELLVEVRNPAPAEPDENLNEWFQPFSRGHRARATGAAGSGLGLAIARRLAEAMDGVIGARREGGDLVFQLVCPVKKSAVPPLAESAPFLVPAHSDHAPRVLVIEDETYNREILVHHLAAWGCRVDQAASGAEAAEIFRRETPDLVVMDWLLGDTDGSVLLPSLLAAAGDRRPPVIVLSAYATDEKAHQAELAGADRFLTKPLQAGRLRLILGELLPTFHPVGANSDTPADAPAPPLREIASRLRESWPTVLACRDSDPDEAARRIHRMRGLARLLPPSELPDALADLERALADRASPAVVRAAWHAVDVLLAQLATTPPVPSSRS